MNKAPKPMPLSETYVVVPVYVDDIARINIHGPVTHLIFTVHQTVIHGNEGDQERIVAARLIVATERLVEIGRALMRGETSELYEQQLKGQIN